MVASSGHFASQSRPKRSPKAPQRTHFPTKSQIFIPDRQLSTKIKNFQQSTYHKSISINRSVFQSPTTGAIKDINALPTRGHSLSLVCLCVCLISEHRSIIFRPSYTYPRTTYILQYGSAAMLRTSIGRQPGCFSEVQGGGSPLCVALPPTHIGGCTLYVGRSTMDDRLLKLCDFD